MKIQITHILIENWRNFRKVDVDLGARTFVVGPNASGKTNFLDALRFLGDVARRGGGGVAEAVRTRGGIGHLRSLHARQASYVGLRINISVDEDSWVYELRLNGTKTVPVRVERERVTKNNMDILPPRPSDADKADPRLREQTHLEQLTQNSKFRELVDALASISSTHIVPQVAKTTSRVETLLREAPGSDFIAQLAELPNKKQRGALNKIEHLLRVAVPQFSKLKIEREPRTGKPHLLARYEHWRAQGSWQSEADFSDGTLRLIGFIWAVMNGKGPLLLEEPELSLHRAVVLQIPRILARAAKVQDRQVITSTHADEMLDDLGIDPSEIILLKPTAEDTRVMSGRSNAELMSAVEARVPLGRVAASVTRPPGVEQLPFKWPDAAAP